MSFLSSNYGGVQWFSFLSNWSGLPVDQINFVLTQIISLTIAPLFRTVLHPGCTEVNIRHGFGLILGLFFSYICFGFQSIHLIGLPTIAYVIMCLQDPKVMQKTVLTVSLIYLSVIHLHRQFYYVTYSLDISGPLMIIVQKVTTLAFSLHDGLTKDDDELSESQRYHAVTRLPNPFEYFSYIFHHQTLMAGPLIFYKDYMNFIQGAYLLQIRSNGNINNNIKLESRVEPSPLNAVIKKTLMAFGCAIVVLKLNPLYPIDFIKTDEFILNTSLFYKLWYLHIVTTLARFKYYYAWVQADAVCNNAGLGFNGYDQTTGASKWDKVSNVNIINFELATSLRDGINSWNIGTSQWLRMIVYDRVTRYSTILTYMLSAVWHGFYLGYYLTFASAALCTIAARTVRRRIRGYFQKSNQSKIFYNILTMLVTRVVFAYLTFSFVILEFWPSFRIYLHTYMCLHILAIAAIFILPRIVPLPLIKDESVNSLQLNGTVHSAYKPIGNGSISHQD